MTRIPASPMRSAVAAAPPLVTSVALSGCTMPMSVARIERTGPTFSGIAE